MKELKRFLKRLFMFAIAIGLIWFSFNNIDMSFMSFCFCVLKLITSCVVMGFVIDWFDED